MVDRHERWKRERQYACVHTLVHVCESTPFFSSEFYEWKFRRPWYYRSPFLRLISLSQFFSCLRLVVWIFLISLFHHISAERKIACFTIWCHFFPSQFSQTYRRCNYYWLHNNLSEILISLKNVFKVAISHFRRVFFIRKMYRFWKISIKIIISDAPKATTWIAVMIFSTNKKANRIKANGTTTAANVCTSNAIRTLLLHCWHTLMEKNKGHVRIRIRIRSITTKRWSCIHPYHTYRVSSTKREPIYGAKADGIDR